MDSKFIGPVIRIYRWPVVVGISCAARGRRRTASGTAAARGPVKGVDMENLSRRKLLASAGVATGAAAIAAAPSVAQAALDHPEATDPSGPPPEETIVAYVRDVKRNEVTVMSGTGE